MSTPLFFDQRQNVEGMESHSPSAGKPARFVALMSHYRYHAYNPRTIGSVTPVTKEDLYRVHKKDHVDRIFDLVDPNGFENVDPRVPDSCLWTIGSLLAAARGAIKDPIRPACSPSSGFHHAGYSIGSGGFCTFNGLMVVVAKLIQENPKIKIGILDLDVHEGNGTTDILSAFPGLAKQVRHHTSGKHFHDADEADEFFLWLEESIADLNAFGCDVVLYQAGADMHRDDPLGGILDDAQMAHRDRTVFRKVRAPIAWNLAGGYRDGESLYTDPVLQTHRNTLLESDASYETRKAFFKD